MLEWILLIVLLTFWFSYIYEMNVAKEWNSDIPKEPVAIIRVGKTAVRADVARTMMQLALGLGFRKKGSMLLVFPKVSKKGIWMLFMRFPLDILFLDEEKRIVRIVRDAKPMTFNPKTWKVYKAGALYVLEVPAGLCKEYNVREGQKVAWN